jgi:Domain of unknown function (DUF4383)
MAHIPVNHPLRPIYRAVAALMGLYLVAFGILGIILTADEGLFGKAGDRVLGQGANLFWAVVSIAIGAVVLIATFLGRNIDVAVNTYLGWTLVVVGTFSLAVIRTDANFLDFSISTVIVSYLVGLSLITAALYSKVAPPEEAGEPRQVREGRTEESAAGRP